MPTTRVANHLDHRLQVLVETLRQQARRRICAAHKGSRRRCVQTKFPILFQTGRGERLKVGALPPLHVDDLDEFAGPDLVGLGRAGGNTPVDTRVGQGLRRRMLGKCNWLCTGNEDFDPGRWVLPIDPHRSTRRCHKAHQRPFGGKRGFVAGTRVTAQDFGRPRRGDIETAPLQADRQRPGRFVARAQDRLQAFRSSGRRNTQPLRVRRACRREGGNLRGLPAFPVANREPVARFQRKDGSGGALGNVALDSDAQRGHAGQQDGASRRWHLRNRRLQCLDAHSEPGTFFRPSA